MTATLLIADAEAIQRNNLITFFNRLGLEVFGAASLSEARSVIQKGNADIIVVDANLPDMTGLAVLEETAFLPVRPSVIILSDQADVNLAVTAMRMGAHDFMLKPVSLEQLEKSVRRAQEIVAMRRELAHLRGEQRGKLDFVIGKSPRMRSILGQAQRAAAVSVSVLITGETGTGKEVLANAIHRFGPRADKPFVAINCAAIQPTVLESELFGYEAGAFTGAEKRKYGLMETADGGILFLDEISSMPMDMQAKLLRALEERAFRRVGGTNLIHVDVQVVAASNRDLNAMIKKQEFREDLYYRLKVVDLELPPLRERKEDLPDLIGLFIRKNNQRMGLSIHDVTSAAMDVLLNYHWPGNIRELKNVIERAMLFCDEEAIDVPHLPANLLPTPLFSTTFANVPASA